MDRRLKITIIIIIIKIPNNFGGFEPTTFQPAFRSARRLKLTIVIVIITIII